MPIQKPTKPSNLVPRAFGGIKNNFSNDLQSTGFEPNIPQTYNGDNLNYHLDATGKELDYVEKVVDFINQTPVNHITFVNENNQLDYVNKDELGSDIEVGDVDGQWTTASIVLVTSASLSAGQSLTYTIPDTIPNDGYDYEIIGNLQARGNTNSDNSSISISTAFGIFGGFRAQVGFRPASFGIGIMKSEDRRIIIQSGASWTDIAVSIVAYRRLGKNQ